MYSVLNKLLDLAPPVLIGAAVDIVVSQEDSFLAEMGVVEVELQLWLLALVTLVIWVLESVFEYLYALKWRRLAQDVEHELRMEAYAHVQRLDLSYFEERSTGGLMSILNDDVNQLERFLDDGANQLIQLGTTMLVVGGMFVALAPSVAWMTLLPMPVVIVGSVWFQRLLEPRYAQIRAHVGVLNGELSNNLSGIATIKSFATEEHEVEQIRTQSRHYRTLNLQAIRLSSAFVPLIRMVIVVGFAAIMVYGGKMAIAGALNVGVYSVLVFMTQRLLWPLTRLGTMLDQYQRAMASTTRVFDVLHAQPTIASGDTPLPLRDVRGNIEMDGVGFRYPHVGPGVAPRVLEDVTLAIEPGQTVAFVGATGAGKSTLIKLLLRFYDVTEGAIRIDGHDVRDVVLGDLRRAIGLVSQDVFLFHGTVRENIAYGSPGASLEQIVAASTVAEAHAFITELPRGYDTIVGERGQKLSGGQRQRVSIARAVLKDPPVLVLDEATSSVDNETEAAIQRSLDRITVGRTTIVIAHRLSTVRNADQTFVLERGRIVERGTHDELLERGGVYAGLWRVQTGLKPEGRET